MKRSELEHVIRAAADVTGDEIVVVGSQAILGEFPVAPEPLLISLEADAYPKHDPERAIEIDGALGDGSQFHQTYGYYAHGVGPDTIVAPARWEERLVRLDVLGRAGTDEVFIAWCLEAHDLVLSKLAAGREKDIVFAEVAIRSGLVRREKLAERLELMPRAASEETSRRLQGVLVKLDRADEVHGT